MTGEIAQLLLPAGVAPRTGHQHEAHCQGFGHRVTRRRRERIQATEPGGNYPIRAVERVCDILDVLQRSREGASLSDVAEVTSLPKSSAYRYLSALEARRYVERDNTNNLYRLGMAFRPQHTRQIDMLVAHAKPYLEKLRDRLGETTNLGVLEGAHIVHALVVESNEMMRLAARVGDRGNLHSTALGKAIAAELTDDRVRTLLAPEPMTPLHQRHPRLGRRLPARSRRMCAATGTVSTTARTNPTAGCVAVALQGLPFPAGISVSAPERRLPRTRSRRWPAPAPQARCNWCATTTAQT